MLFKLALATQAQTLDQRLVTRFFLALDVVEQTTTLTHHDQQTAARVEVVLVLFHVLGEVLDPLGQDRDLHFRGTGVTGLKAVFSDEFRLAFYSNRHSVFSLSAASCLKIEDTEGLQLSRLEPCQRQQLALYGQNNLAVEIKISELVDLGPAHQ